MKVSTLIYIHKVLVEEETRKLLLKNAAALKVKESNFDVPEWGDLNKKLDEARREWEAAHEARVDFEQREW